MVVSCQVMILPVELNLTFFALNDYLDQMNDLCRNET